MDRALAFCVVASLGLAGCGSSSMPVNPAPFAWLSPSSPPADWGVAHTAAATLAYPPGWSRAHADAGAATATLQTGNVFHGYLNATPQQGAEQLRGWARFRLNRNRDEGDANVTEVAAAEGLPFRGGRGSCLIDDYRAKVGTVHYREIACLVVGAHGGTVLIAATPLGEVPTRQGLLEQAVSHFAVN
jgi:hypothetical protein